MGAEARASIVVASTLSLVAIALTITAINDLAVHSLPEHFRRPFTHGGRRVSQFADCGSRRPGESARYLAFDSTVGGGSNWRGLLIQAKVQVGLVVYLLEEHEPGNGWVLVPTMATMGMLMTELVSTGAVVGICARAVAH